MPRDQRNVDVAAFANRLSIVHCFQDGQSTRMPLHCARHCVQIPCALMIRERLPFWKRVPRCLDRDVNISPRSLRDGSELLASRRIDAIEEFACSGLAPSAINEMSKLSFVAVEPD